MNTKNKIRTSCFRHSCILNNLGLISVIASLEIKRYYSSLDFSDGKDSPKPLIHYTNSDTLKLKILIYNQGSVYM